MRQELERIVGDAINAVSSSWVLTDRTRAKLLRRWGMDIATNARISPGCYFGGPDVKVGRYSYVNRGVLIESNARVEIGDFCALGMNVMVATSHHDFGSASQRAGDIDPRPVTIGDGCWLGANVAVMPGVSIGPGCVIAAGSVVIADCERDCLYAGTPAQLKRRLD